MAFFYKTKGLVLPVSLGLAGLLVWSDLCHGQEQDWQWKNGAFESRSLTVGNPLQMSLNGSTASLQGSDQNASATVATHGVAVYTFDHRNWEVLREVRFDAKRNALRVLDTFSNKSAEDARLRVDYNTALTRGRDVRFNGTISDNGEVREQGNGFVDSSIGVIALAETSQSQALPLFIWGQHQAPWKLNVQDIGSYLRFGYEGPVSANGKAALLHWVATAGLDKKVKLERTFDLFWKNQRLVDPLLTPEQALLVVNFNAEALKPGEAEDEAELDRRQLVMLDAVCDKLGVVRGEKDVLWLGDSGAMEGEFQVKEILCMPSSGKSMTLAASQIAALRGGSGLGRGHRLYLRDGTVLAGQVSLTEGVFSSGMGTLPLDANALDMVIMKTRAEDGKKPPGAKMFAMTMAGEWLWFDALKTVNLDVVTSFGRVPVTMEQLRKAERQNEPPFQYVLSLADGSRLNGIFEARVFEGHSPGRGNVALPLALLSSFGAVDAAQAAGEDSGDSPVESFCQLRDGSRLSGFLKPVGLKLQLGMSEIPFKADDVTRLQSREAGNVAVELKSGSKINGALDEPFLVWNLGGRDVSLPVAMISEIQQKPAVVTKAEPSQKQP